VFISENKILFQLRYLEGVYRGFISLMLTKILVCGVQVLYL